MQVTKSMATGTVALDGRRVMLAVLLSAVVAIVMAVGLVLPSGAGAAMVDAGGGHSAGIAADGTLWAWGHNDHGQLGNNSTTDSWVPIEVLPGSTWTTVSAGGGHTLAIRSDAPYAGTLWAWGYNSNGQVGNGATSDQLTPVQIDSNADWSDVSAGESHSMGIRSGMMWGWGRTRIGSGNNDNRLGLGSSFADKTVPTRVGTATDWASVSAGGAHTMAIKINSQLWATGLGGDGQLGRGNLMSVTQFTQVVSAPPGYPNTYAKVSAGALHTLAIDTAGNLWSWGNDAYGQRGDGAAGGALYTHRNLFPGTTNWISVSAGNNHSAALNLLGEIWTFGYNFYGQLGDDSTTDRTVPVQEAGLDTDWIAVAGGGNHTLAIKSDGTLYGTGDNQWGQLGNGTTDNRDTFTELTPPSNTAPVANDDTTSTNEDTSVDIAVRANDTDAEGDAVVSLVGAPSSGTALVNLDGTITYTPALDFNGTATFTYMLNDGEFSDTAAVSVTVTPVNDEPSFTKGADEAVTEDAGARSVTGWATAISAGAADESGQTLDFDVSNDNNALFTSQPAISSGGTLTYTPAANAYGSATVSVSLTDDGGTANDGVDSSPVQTFTITVTPVNDAPVANADDTTVDRGGHRQRRHRGVLANDTDVEGDTLTVDAGRPTRPTASVTLNADGSFTYTPNANYNGTDSFTYRAI